jgi:hypothetical protein
MGTATAAHNVTGDTMTNGCNVRARFAGVRCCGTYPWPAEHAFVRDRNSEGCPLLADSGHRPRGECPPLLWRFGQSSIQSDQLPTSLSTSPAK